MKDENRLNMIEEKKASPFKRILAVLLITALLIAAAGGGALYVLFRGPFIHAQAAFVQEVGHTPVGSRLVSLLITDAQLDLLLSIDSGTGIASGHRKTFSIHPNLG